MLKDDQYAINSGKLLRVLKPAHRRPWLMFFLLLFAIGLGAGGVVYVYRDLLITPEGSLLNVYSSADEALGDTRLGLPSNMREVYDVYLSPEQLELVFDASFGDVNLSPEKRKIYLESVSKWAAHYAMPPLLVLSMIWRESTFNEETVSSAEARGPMQVIYKHHKEKLDRLDKVEADLHNIDVGVHVGVQILREYFDRYNRDIFRTLLAYVGGQHKTYAPDIMRRYFDARIFLEEHFKNLGEETESTASLLPPTPPAESDSVEPAPSTKAPASANPAQ